MQRHTALSRRITRSVFFVLSFLVGATFSASATEAQDTLCGSSNGEFFTSQPTSGLCLPGSTFGGIYTNQGEWTWYCHGATASYQCHGWIDARCGSSNGGSFEIFPSGNLCLSGSPTGSRQENGLWKWECQSYTGTAFSPAPPNDIDHCQATVITPQRIYPSCGSSYGKLFESAPTGGFCATGKLKSGPTATQNGWDWTCEEEPNVVISPSPQLVVVKCSAIKKSTPPTCGSANGGNFSSAPTSNLCSNGTLKSGPTRTSSGWDWTCEEEPSDVISPAVPLETVSCSANWQPILPTCGSAQGSWSARAPRDSNLCSIGTSGSVSQGTLSGNPSWNWTCSNDGRNQTCNAWVQPTCGSANGSEQTEKPTTNLCATGNPSTVVENSASGWSWDCLNNTDSSHRVNCSSTRPTQNSPVCGNGTIETGEECDDGNRDDRDGCSSLCKKETPATPKPTDPQEPSKEEEEKDCDASIGDIVWNDLNKNGIQDNGEGGISGITIKLLHGDKVDKDKTNDEGKYSFKDLCKGSYRITVDANDIREGCYPTYDRDRDLDHATTAKIKSDEKYRDADFGYYCPTAPRTGAGAIAIAISATLAGLAVIFGRRFLKLR